MLFGRILQHDDDIPSPELNKAFKRNSYDWQVDYSGIITQINSVLTRAAEPVPHGLFFRINLHWVPSCLPQRSRDTKFEEA